MLNALRIFFRSPTYEGDLEKTQDARTTHRVSIALLVLGVLSAPLTFLLKSPVREFALGSTGLGMLIWLLTIYLVKRERRTLAKVIILTVNTFNLYFVVFAIGGLSGSTIFTMLFLLALANLLFPRSGVIVYGVILLGLVSILYGLDLAGIVSDTVLVETPRSIFFIFLFTLISTASVMAIASANFQRNLDVVRKSESELLERNIELDELRGSLEIRITDRTADLESANQRNEKRARQFEAIAQVARATTTNENLNTLLPRLALLVSEQFDFYHTGIFLIDEHRQHAVLSATNSIGGKRMLERGHKLQIGQTGIVGFVSATGTPRIALDVGTDAVFFDNPDLPNTRSEMALPLRITDEIIGILDIQSTEANAFQEEDIDILSTLADQVAIAIQNARTYQTMQELLEEAQKESGAYIQDAWRVLQAEQSILGYRVSDNKIASLAKPLNSSEVRQAMQNKETVAQNGPSATLAIPIRLRNQVIGVMDIHASNEHEWDNDEVDIAEAVADRLSLALESSLLLKSTQKQADIERITADISSKISSTTQFDAILRTAAEELSRALGGSDVLVQLHQDETVTEE